MIWCAGRGSGSHRQRAPRTPRSRDGLSIQAVSHWRKRFRDLIEGADATITALTGKVDVRFAETMLIDLAPAARRSTSSSLTRCPPGRSSC
jgi:hypothetical protein